VWTKRSAFRVRLRRPYRRLDDLDAFAVEDGIEVTSELAVTVADQEAKSRALLLERLPDNAWLRRAILYWDEWNPSSAG
jgi:hypothetical protein